jgi:hypothetical protein
MDGNQNIVQRNDIKGIAIGMLLMAFFTLVWTAIAETGLHGLYYIFVLSFFSLFSLLLIINALYLFSIAMQFPEGIREKDDKQWGRRFGIIFGTEGILIFILVNILINVHRGYLVVPCIALIVGLHFYFLAPVFKRKIDYYIGTWTCIVAIIGIILASTTTIKETNVFIGIGVAIATLSYGVNMILTGYHSVRSPKSLKGKIIN